MLGQARAGGWNGRSRLDGSGRTPHSGSVPCRTRVSPAAASCLRRNSVSRQSVGGAAGRRRTKRQPTVAGSRALLEQTRPAE